MTAAPVLEWGEAPDNTQWPGPDTFVLLNRDLRPGTGLSRLSRFGEDLWDVTPAIFEEHSASLHLNFSVIPLALRPAAKFYVWQLLNHPDLRALRGASDKRIAVRTIAGSFQRSIQFVFQWFAEQGVSAFCQVTAELLDDYLDVLQDDEVPVERCYRRIIEIRRLWAHREILPAGLRLPEAPPWAGVDTRELLDRRRGDRENRTRRIGEPTMQTLLCWAIRFEGNFADDILAAHAEYLDVHARSPHQRTPTSTSSSLTRWHRHGPGELRRKATAYLADLAERGEALPGVRNNDGQLVICWRQLAAALGCSGGVRHTATGRMILKSGLPISEHSLLNAPITGLLGGKPWRPHRISYQEAPHLARLLSTACLIIVAYLSGARAGEVFNLRRGCIKHDSVTGLWLMNGLYFKGAEDEDGNKVPEGKTRPDPWVVLELVAHAIAVLERLHPSPSCSPGRSGRTRSGATASGGARPVATI